jgi:biopolymer transport protein ExbB
MLAPAQKVFVALLLLAWWGAACAWWHADWSYRKTLTLDTTAAGADLRATVPDFPLLVRLHLANFAYFTDTRPDGADLRVMAGDDKTPLKFHLERYDPVAEVGFLWVKLPHLAPATSTERLWLYYGNPKAKPGADPGGTYDAATGLVLHFAEAPGAAPQDSTAYANHPTRFAGEVSPTSYIGGGARLTGAGGIEVEVTPSLRLVPEDGWTFSAWVRPEGEQTSRLVELRDADGSLELGVDGTAVYARWIRRPGVPPAQASSSPPGPEPAPEPAAPAVLAGPAGKISPGSWHHLAVVAGVGRLAVYLDGAEVASVPAAIAELGGSLVIGNDANGANGFVGEIDEVQVARTVRSADWVQASHRFQGDGADLALVAGEDEARQGGGHSYFAVILKSVTVDGWIVIAILALMLGVSVMVMVGKFLVLSRTEKDNRAFLDQFRRLGAGETVALNMADAEKDDDDKAIDDSALLSALFGKHDHYQGSSVYRLYHVGVQELDRRAGRAAGAASVGLSPQSLAAIRASLDAALVRETHQLNAQMVLLTIAISGGPFLGLLGTVIGVMVTFAAIAATGDVNINAIAPGIAAALVATVAGLAVAIPALFGYNYLLVQIRNVMADMQVFVDEFMSRLAEAHGR